MNLGWVDVDGLAGAHQTRILFPKKSLNKSVGSFPQDVFYHILSIVSSAHLSWHIVARHCANELWMVDRGFLLPFPFKVSFQKLRLMNFGGQDFGFLLFSFHFPFKVSFSTTSKNKLWMVDLGFSAFPIPFSFQSFLARSVQTWILEGRSWILAFSHPILLSNFHFLKPASHCGVLWLWRFWGSWACQNQIHKA